MPFSYTEYTGDGSTTDFAITFDYLDRDHVFVTVAGLKTTDVSSLYEFSFVNDTTVRVVLSADGTSAVPSATTIRVGRDTNIDNPPVTWTEGAALTTTDLNKLSNYLTYALQESLDANEGAALATLAQEAAEAAQALAEAAQSGAETAETNAETAQGLAEAAQTAAEAAQTAAEAAQGLAETARDKAQDWAEELEDVEVETGQYSAFHWAEKASASATAAAASAASIGPDADFDSLTLTPGTGGGDLEIVSADNTSTGGVFFSDQAAADQGFVRYDHDVDRLQLGAGGHQYLSLGVISTTPWVFDMPSGHDNTTNWIWNGGKETGNNSYHIIVGASAGEVGVLFGDDDDNADGWVRYDNATRDLIFGAGNGNGMRLTSSGRLGIGTGSPAAPLSVVGIYLGTGDISVNAGGTSETPIGASATTSAHAGARLSRDGWVAANRVNSYAGYFNRLDGDGGIFAFYGDGTMEGTISVSGTTVSYNGGHLARWSRLPGEARQEILKGTVMTNLDEMVEWVKEDGTVEDNEQLNKTEVSSVVGDKNVAGLFVAWDDDDDTFVNDFFLAMTGDFIIRIRGDVTVERGDLLMSAGDGTAMPQDDDIIRSKTIAKVTSTERTIEYPDGSYCVPCVLMAC